MFVEGVFVDNIDYSYLPGVSVQVVDRFYKPTGAGTVANDDGYFALDSNLLSQDGYLLYATSVDHQPKLIDPLVFQETFAVQLDRAYQDLSAVVVTAPKKEVVPAQKTSGIGWLIAIAAAALLFSKPKPKRA